MGLAAPRLLARGAPEKVIYSLLLYERDGERNELRLQADNYGGPFDMNEGTKLDPGATAKPRTLVSYLEIVGALYERLRSAPEAALSGQAVSGGALSARGIGGGASGEKGGQAGGS